MGPFTAGPFVRTVRDGGGRGAIRILSHSLSLSSAGGVELSLVELGLALVERGHQLGLLYGSDGGLRPQYEAAGVWLDGGHRFGFAPGTALQDLHSFGPSIRAARGFRPNVLWLQRFEHIVWGQAVARASRTPVVCHLHHVPNYNRLALLGRGLTRYIAVSEYLRDVWVAGGLDPRRVAVVHNAIPPGKYRPGGLAELDEARRRLGLPRDAAVVTYYGRLTKEKGLDTVVGAWHRIPASAPPRHLLLVGDPPVDDRSPWGRAVTALVAGGEATVLPMRDDVLPVLHAADVVLLPARVPEGFGRVVIEGLSTGRPVIASRIGAIPEILHGPMKRFLVPPGDAAALARAITGLLDWRIREPQLAGECTTWVREHFPFERAVSAVETVLRDSARQLTSGTSAPA